MKKQPKSDVHLFTTDHPYFIDIGLGSFTTGTLIDWWNQKTADGRYLNRRHVNEASDPSDPLAQASNLDKLLGITSTTEFSWYGWKPNTQIENAGRFKKQNLYGLNGHNGGNKDDEWKYQVNTTHTIADPNSLANIFANEAPIVGVILVANTLEPITQGAAGYEPLQSLKPLYSLIQLNKYMTCFDDYQPRELWSTTDPETHSPLPKSSAFGSWALLTEIKAAKSGPFLEWTAPVTLYVGQNNGLGSPCIITENITFKLYLGDQSMIKVGTNAVTVKNLTIVGPKRDVFGAAPELDGERVAVDQNDIANHTAGELDVQYNSVTKKWQSGNVNCLAKLVTDLQPASQVPDLDHLLNDEIKDILDDPDNKYSYIPARGSGMPIRVQNSMPLQWSPSYALTKDSRCYSTNNKQKQITPVYNFNPKRFYPSGEEVLLTYIDGIWHVSSLGEANATPPTAVSAQVGKWGSFTYMATSSEFFFKAKRINDGALVNVTPRSAELNFHKLFYQNAQSYDTNLNYDVDYGFSGGYDTELPFNTKDQLPWYDERGYYQITSFDFLDSKIFGIKGKVGIDGKNNTDTCAISSTSATLNSAGNVIPFDNDNYPNRNSAHTGGFFGCVFPNGYNGTETYDSSSWQQLWKIGSYGLGTDPIVKPDNYFTLSDNAGIFKDEDGNRTTSNVKCLATESDNKAAITPDDQGSIPSNLWSRGTIKPDASMFYLGADQGRKTIPADVMLNASPKGANGSPIKPIGLFNKMNPINGIVPVIGNPYIADLVTGGCWLNRLPSTNTGIFDPFVSAFDFAPKNKSNLMFRPLKLEAYLSFGTFGANYGYEVDVAKNLDVNFCKKTIEGFYAEIARTQTDYRYPISYYTPLREFENCQRNIAHPVKSAGRPLKWGAWTRNKPLYTPLHKKYYWYTGQFGALEWTGMEAIQSWKPETSSNWLGAGAFGIITTSNKIKANSKIEFTTKNLYGMSAAASPPPNRDLGIQFFFGSDWTQDRTWGVSNFIDSYKQHNIIDLSVRIYQGHPDTAMVYDPRYFAVHHFNPGVEFLYDKYYGTGNIPLNSLGAYYTGLNTTLPKRNFLQEEFKNIRGSNNDILSKVTYVYPEASGVDIKIPSRFANFIDNSVNPNMTHNNTGVYTSIPIPTGMIVFSDGTMQNSILYPPLMLEQYWMVDTIRTGKLLPYRYKKKTFGIPGNITNGANLIAETGVKGKFVKDYAANLIVKNYGSGYSLNDVIGIPAYDVSLKVTAIGINPLNNGAGAITAVEIINNGSGIPHTFALPSGATIGSINSSLKMLNIQTQTGAGFDAYFMCVQLYEKIAIDKKPYLIKTNGSLGDSIVRIASDKSGPSNQTTGSTANAEAASYVDESYTTAFNIDNIVKSKDSSYDIFFHFHNDISFTWLACGAGSKPHGDTFNLTESTEQHITIERINLT